MGFSLFKSKAPALIDTEYKLQEVLNDVFSYFQSVYPDDVETAKVSFVKLTGQFDEEHEYFESKLDDFRNWFLFFYDGAHFTNLKKIKEDDTLEKYYDYLTSGVFSLFLVQKIKGEQITLKDISDNKVYKVNNSVAALSMEKGDCIQTSLYHYKGGIYEFGLSIVAHPVESVRYIRKKVKEVKKGKGITQEGLFERLIGMRYQFFKYRQLEVKQIYSDKSLLFEKISEA